MEGFERTLTYYRAPKEAWRRIRTTSLAGRHIRGLTGRLESIAACGSGKSLGRMVFAATDAIAARGYPANSKTALHTMLDGIVRFVFLIFADICNRICGFEGVRVSGPGGGSGGVK